MLCEEPNGTENISQTVFLTGEAILPRYVRLLKMPKNWSTMVLSLKGLQIKLLDKGWKNVFTVCGFEPSSIECSKTKPKPITYQLDYSANLKL